MPSGHCFGCKTISAVLLLTIVQNVACVDDGQWTWNNEEGGISLMCKIQPRSDLLAEYECEHFSAQSDYMEFAQSFRNELNAPPGRIPPPDLSALRDILTKAKNPSQLSRLMHALNALRVFAGQGGDHFDEKVNKQLADDSPRAFAKTFGGRPAPANEDKTTIISDEYEHGGVPAADERRIILEPILGLATAVFANQRRRRIQVATMTVMALATTAARDQPTLRSSLDPASLREHDFTRQTSREIMGMTGTASSRLLPWACSGGDFDCSGCSCDYLRDDDDTFCGTAGPNGVGVASGSTITFSSDYGASYSGFEICLLANVPATPAPTPVPSDDDDDGSWYYRVGSGYDDGAVDPTPAPTPAPTTTPTGTPAPKIVCGGTELPSGWEWIVASQESQIGALTTHADYELGFEM